MWRLQKSWAALIKAQIRLHHQNHPTLYSHWSRRDCDQSLSGPRHDLLCEKKKPFVNNTQYCVILSVGPDGTQFPRVHHLLGRPGVHFYIHGPSLWSDGPDRSHNQVDQTVPNSSEIWKTHILIWTLGWISVFWYLSHHLRYMLPTRNQFIKFSNPKIENIASNPLAWVVDMGFMVLHQTLSWGKLHH